MTPYPYINPYHLPGISPETGLDSTLLRKAQKELMAEFELNEAAAIQLGTQQLGKSEVLAFFERLESEEVKTQHEKLVKMPALLAFLEEADPTIFQEKKYAEMLSQVEKDEGFRAFLAPFYAFRFNELFLKFFKERNEEGIRLLVSQPLWLPLQQQQACYEDGYKQLQLELEGVKRLALSMQHGNQAPGPEVQEASDENWIHLLNVLPGPFEGLVNAYAKALESLALALFNTYQRAKLAKYVLRQGLKLNINTETAGRLQYVLDQLLKVSADDSFGIEDIQAVFDEKKKGIKMWQIALGGLVVYLLFRLI